MRILHTNFLRGWGGQSNRILVKCDGLRKKGHEVLLSVPPKSELAKRARAAGIETTEAVNYCGGVRPGVLGDISKMKALIKTWRPEIIHLHGGRDSWVVAATLLSMPRKERPLVIRTKHNVFPIADHVLNRWLYGSFFDAIICLSSAVDEQCRQKPYISNEKLWLIPSACDCSRFDVESGTRQRMRQEFGFSQEHKVVAMTGRMRPEKGHEVLLEAAPLIASRCPNVRFLLLGSGSLKHEVCERLASQGLSQHFHVAGFRNDIPACLAAADLYVQPSLSEGLGTSVLEACAAGLAVVASRVGGIPDIIDEEKNGLLFETGSAQGLAQAMLRLLEDDQLRSRLASHTRECIETKFSVAQMVDKTEAAYKELLDKKD